MANVYLGDAPFVSFATDAELEERIRVDPRDDARRLVYADWLAAQGDPRGELMVVQHRLSSDPTSEQLRAREKDIFDQHGGFRGGVHPELVSFDWRLGLVERLRLSNAVDWMDDSFDVRPIARRLFDLPTTRFLRELALGVLRWEYQSEDVPVVLEEASKSAFASGLRSLLLGDLAEEDVDNAHHSIGDISAVFGGAFPRLERLRVWGYEIAASSGPFAHPELGDLAIQTCALRKELYDAIVSGDLPKLERLELWFGSENYGCQLGVEDLSSLLAGTQFPRLKHLGLRNAEFTNELVSVLLAAPILTRLESLDLSMGVLAAEGARVLLEHGAAWRHLKTLDVSESLLAGNDALLDQLRAVGPEILAGDQRDDEDPTYRYVAVHE
ncbi:MAG: TIGR02996 domain-containing protein [Polyangiales bacterium]